MSQSNFQKGDLVKLKYSESSPLTWTVTNVSMEKNNDEAATMVTITDGFDTREIFADLLILVPKP